jgi:transposase
MIVAQAAALAQLRAEVAQVNATVEALVQRRGRNSRHSSQPPSADPPQTTTRPHREPSGRRPGGQPGHEGQSRALVPVEEVDVGIPVKPVQCARGQQPLQGDAPQPQRHQVTEIPPVKPVVMEYQLHQLRGLACGAATRAELPVGVPWGALGPRLQAITALCTGA